MSTAALLRLTVDFYPAMGGPDTRDVRRWDRNAGMGRCVLYPLAVTGCRRCGRRGALGPPLVSAPPPSRMGAACSLPPPASMGAACSLACFTKVVSPAMLRYAQAHAAPAPGVLELRIELGVAFLGSQPVGCFATNGRGLIP